MNQTSILLETVQCHNFNNNKQIKTFFDQNRHRASRVKTLEYNFQGDMPELEMEKMQSVFPNIEHLRLFFSDKGFHSSSLHARQYASRYQRQGSQRSMRNIHPQAEDIGDWLQLKSIEETSPLMYTSAILNLCKKTYDHLTLIWLNFVHCNTMPIEQAMDYLFTGFKNAPMLESLTLTYSHITFDRLDTLHNSCPKLIDLTLIKPVFFKHPTAPDQRFIFDIRPLHYEPKPTESLKKLIINEALFVGGIPILEYTAHKYPQIEHVVCNMDIQSHNGSETFHESTLIHVALRCKQLKYLDTNLCNYTSDVLEIFGKFESALEINQFNLTSSQPLLALETLSLTRFRHSLKKLNIEQPYVDMKRFILMMSRFTNLTSVELFITEDESEDEYNYFDDKAQQVPLVQFLTHQKNLKRLSLRRCYITIDQDPVGFQTNIEELSLVDVLIVEPTSYQSQNAALLDFLSESCLNLKQLHVFGYWHNKRPSTETKLNLLKHHQLSHVDVYIKRHPYIQYIAGPGEEIWFEREEHEDFTTTCYELREKPQEVDTKVNYMTIQCKNTDAFYTPIVYYSEPYRF